MKGKLPQELSGQQKTRAEIETERTKKKKALVLEFMHKSLGVVTPAIQAAKVGRTTFYRWKQEDPAFCAAVDSFQDVALDFVEGKLYQLIKEGNPAATIFYLKTKGRNRGYIEKAEIKVQHERLTEKELDAEILRLESFDDAILVDPSEEERKKREGEI